MFSHVAPSAFVSGRVTGLVLSLSFLVCAACSSSPAGTTPGTASGGAPTGSGGSASGGVSGGSGGSAGGGTGGAPTGTGGATTGTGGGASGGSPAVGTGGSASGGASGGAGGRSSSGGVAGPGGGATGTAGANGANGGGIGYGGPSRCANASVALCEDFENGLDSARWTTTKSGDGSVVVDGTHFARGSKALHIKTTAGNGYGYIKETKSFPATNNLLYGRMFLWFEDDITTTGHFSLAEGAGTGTSGLIRFGGQYKGFGVGTDQGASGDWTDHDSKMVPSKTWICAEFEFKGDTNEFRVWWDDVELTSLRSGPSTHANFTMPKFTSLWFGWWMYNMTEPQELWIDEIAVDYKPIGCAK